MTALWLVVGENANIVGQGTVTPSSAHADFPASNLGNGDPSVPWVAGNANAPQEVIVDHNIAKNAQGVAIAAGFEHPWVAGAPAGWNKFTTSGTATVTEETTVVAFGAKSVKFVKANELDACVLWTDYLVPSGWTMGCRIWGRFTNTYTTVRLQDLSNGFFAQGADLWGPAVTDWNLPETVAGWEAHWIASNGFVPLKLQPRSVTKRDLTTIRVIVGQVSGANAGGAPAYVDEFSFFGGVDFASIHRSNFRPMHTLNLASSMQEPGDVWTTRWTAPGQEDIYAKLATPYVERFSRLQYPPATVGITGGHPAVPKIGELVLSQATNLLKPTQGLRIKEVQPQSRAGNGRFRYRETEKPHRTLDLEFLHTDDLASFEQMRDDIYRRSGGGVFPVVFAWPKESEVPTATPTTDPGNVVFGVLAEDLELGKELLPHFRQVLRIEELPAPAPWFG